ncbi:hypothetical protein BKA69DRAFT_1040463 [Paraphysoderma sedebokerense]|nr:hypothetical protein BKA69DRAFT_1040463 [Paraphysoderma sedebokerense]
MSTFLSTSISNNEKYFGAKNDEEEPIHNKDMPTSPIAIPTVKLSSQPKSPATLSEKFESNNGLQPGIKLSTSPTKSPLQLLSSSLSSSFGGAPSNGKPAFSIPHLLYRDLNEQVVISVQPTANNGDTYLDFDSESVKNSDSSDSINSLASAEDVSESIQARMATQNHITALDNAIASTVPDMSISQPHTKPQLPLPTDKPTPVVETIPVVAVPNPADSTSTSNETSIDTPKAAPMTTDYISSNFRSRPESIASNSHNYMPKHSGNVSVSSSRRRSNVTGEDLFDENTRGRSRSRHSRNTSRDGSRSEWHGRSNSPNEEELFEIKKRFLEKLAEALFMCAAPTHRLEHLLVMASEALKLKSHFAIFPNLLIIYCESQKIRLKETVLVTATPSYDLAKLYVINAITKQLAEKEISLEIATRKMEELIASPHSWSLLSLLITGALSSFLITPLAFYGTWVDAFISGLIGGIVGVFNYFAKLRDNPFRYLSDAICAMSASIFGVLMKYAVESWGWYPQHVMSGTVRLAHGLVKSLTLGLGIALGTRICTFINPNLTIRLSDQCRTESYPIWVFMILIIFFSISLSIQLQATHKQLGIMAFTTLVAYWVNWALTQNENTVETTAAFTSFVVGLISNTYSRFTGNPGIAPTLSGVLFLVPGGLGVKSSLKILDQDISSGSKFSFQVIVIALSISLGLLGSRIIPPVETHLSKKKVEKNIVIGAEKENIGNGKDGSESRKGSGEGDREEIADKKGRKVTISIPMLPLRKKTNERDGKKEDNSLKSSTELDGISKRRESVQKLMNTDH